MNVLEDLRTISLGDLTFLLPENLQELQESLGGLGGCVRVGYSLVGLEDTGWFLFGQNGLVFF